MGQGVMGPRRAMRAPERAAGNRKLPDKGRVAVLVEPARTGPSAPARWTVERRARLLAGLLDAGRRDKLEP